jgi:hypothetical protein
MAEADSDPGFGRLNASSMRICLCCPKCCPELGGHRENPIKYRFFSQKPRGAAQQDLVGTGQNIALTKFNQHAPIV